MRFLAGRFFAVDFFFAVLLRAVDFLAVDLRAVLFLAVDFFFAGALFLVAFLAPDDAFFAGLTSPPFVNALLYGWLLPSKATSSSTKPSGRGLPSFRQSHRSCSGTPSTRSSLRT